jgi:hypothetical protein
MQREETIVYSDLMHYQMHFQNKPNVHNGDQIHGAQSVLKRSKFVYLMTSVPKFL